MRLIFSALLLRLRRLGPRSTMPWRPRRVLLMHDYSAGNGRTGFRLAPRREVSEIQALVPFNAARRGARAVGIRAGQIRYGNWGAAGRD